MKVLALCALALPAAAQQLAEPVSKVVLGSVAGHITCADTQRPARLAEVGLLRVPQPSDTPAGSRRGGELEGNFGEIARPRSTAATPSST